MKAADQHWPDNESSGENPERKRDANDPFSKNSQDLGYYQLLAGKLRDGSITPEERKLLDQWYDHFDGRFCPADGDIKNTDSSQHPGINTEVHTDLVLDNDQKTDQGSEKASDQDAEGELRLELPPSIAISEAAHAAKLRAGIDKRIKKSVAAQSKGNGKGSVLQRRLLVAAAVFILILGGLWFLGPMLAGDGALDTTTAKIQPVAVPGHTGAVLRLSGGRTIVLDSLKDGVVIQQGDVKIVKENGTLKYLGKSNKTVYNDVVTDKGRQWHMYLPDGTQVWLNAGSSLHFPVSFKGQKERIVTLTGEAYFKVVHNAAQPFKVKAGTQLIEDIGTSFNVNAYEDEPEVRTTLVEGALKVNKIDLKPGWQATTGKDGQVQTQKVNTEQITAWMQGQLSLNNVSIEEIMKQLSRWYNVTVVYEGPVPRRSLRLGGLLDKNAALEDIVKSLRDFGINVRLQDQQLLVGADSGGR